MAKANCENCVYYDPFEVEYTDGSKGRCRRNPPGLVAVSQFYDPVSMPDAVPAATTWPEVYSDDWCGHFTPKQDGPRLNPWDRPSPPPSKPYDNTSTRKPPTSNPHLTL